MKSDLQKSRSMFLAAVCIFGTIGILRRYIPLSSSLVALVRGVIGAAFLLLAVLFSKKALNWQTIRQNFLFLSLSGAAIGFNWILLFEAYNYTSVATATLCYYLAPILVILLSPLVLHDRLTPRKILCTVVSLAGMVLVSGVLDADFTGLKELYGIFFGLGAAVLYACVILANKKFPGIPAYEKTIMQLSMAAISLLPYVLLTEDLSSIALTPVSLVLLLVAGVVHTGIAYWLYFGSMGALPSHSVALLSYLDPVLAVLLSLVLLQEPMTVSAGIGAAMVLTAACISEQ